MKIAEITLDNVKHPTDKQKAVGILGSATLTIRLEGAAILAQLRDMTLCKSMKGNFYIQPPYRRYTTKDATTGQDVEQKYYHYIIWPSKDNQSHLTQLVEKMRVALNAPTGQGTAPSANPPAPVVASSSKTDLF